MCACRVRILTSVLARRRIVCARGRRVCAFTSVRCIDVSCACAVTSLVRAQPSCVCFHERAFEPSCVRVHERARAAVVCARSRACVRVDVSCACAPCACCHERYGPSVHFRPGMSIPNSQPWYGMAL